MEIWCTFLLIAISVGLVLIDRASLERKLKRLER